MRPLLIALLCVMPLGTVCRVGHAADLGLGIIKPLAPDLTLDIGLTASYRVFTAPDDWLLFGGRDIYADLLAIGGISGKPLVGLGASIQAFAVTRLGGVIWPEGGGAKWSVYLVLPGATVRW